ncbi:DUF2065 domain-containing protein [Candidatus Macondimonas diazotrophica]|jgi:hypothetical protein|uniref:DUF2065 domain-containing protein n=1 Tax=Candidatus Macondimonas diazotrophica TaxID=2305248 RepID=A0A4Z0F6W5_9GAMM|nr:DUF2065 family protein [Candidatus Macondimonas diazotrophica]NCU01368.1 DUF2065 domain-containing protein [Candidatus Macondimonas diazotrophica]TFZ81992.1 DUF2065 domain-containing protein [Candidatus Macondimonas diazotrophica]HBG52219.1 DUF2065 domain-containing protein [Gammaproteobacteria bacterium]
MAQELITALGLVLVLEGVLPVAAPRLWQRGLAQLSNLPPAMARILGLVSLVVGWLIVRAEQ